MRDLIFRIITLTGIPWFFREVFNRNKVTILLFHAPTPQHAKKQLLVLKQKYNIIPLSRFVEALGSNSSNTLPPKSLVLTYDDGAKENYLLKPILEKNSIPITIFLCSSITNTNRHYWWTAVPDGTSISDLEKIPNDSRLSFLEKNKFTQTNEYTTRQALSIEEIESLSAYVDFQSHTCFHPNLPQCSDEESYAEINKSKTELESLFSHKIYAIAFPNGAYTEREIKFVKDSGYKCALTTKVGFNSLNEDIYHLKRIDIADQAGTCEVIVKASVAWHMLKTVFSTFLTKQYNKGTVK